MRKTDLGSRTSGPLVKVIFELPQDDEGWPPMVSEGLWAAPVAPEVVRLDNTPFFVRRVATGDLIRVRRGGDGRLWADGTVQWSGHCTIRIVVFPDGPLGGALQRVLDMFTPLGATGEGAEQLRLLALDVPPDADLATMKRLLCDGERDGWWTYDEGCIGDAWAAIEPR